MLELVLAVNSGSSSLKCGLYPKLAVGYPVPLARLELSGIGGSDARRMTWDDGRRDARTVELPDLDAAIAEAMTWLEPRLGAGHLTAVGHRLVRGPLFNPGPRLFDAALHKELEELVPLAPLHLPGELACVRQCERSLGDVPHVACFDHAFFRDMPDVAARLPLPRQWFDMGVRRIGFHGLSYEYLCSRVPTNGRVILAHLGSGASMAALRDGAVVDATMGFTPAGGLMMATRPGDLDPGVVLEVVRQLTPEHLYLNRFFNQQCGWKAVSGGISDMHELLARAERSVLARQAVDAFVYQARKQLGGLVATLGGLDRLVFSGGIGEHAAPIREAICEAFGYLGLELDPEANVANRERISNGRSRVEVRVAATDENAVIAAHTGRVAAARGSVA